RLILQKRLFGKHNDEKTFKLFYTNKAIIVNYRKRNGVYPVKS
ncbi:MAG: hypothetical protein JWM28_1848, partial [Chitinophagaceae bacterium]|nr:hypothetical protein [Chitinophagaceae bacterium]